MSSKRKSSAQAGSGAALVPKLRFPEFQNAPAWEPVSLRKASVPVDERVGERKLTPVSISAGIGFVPQAEKFGRDISGSQYQLYTLVRDGDFVFNKGNSLKFPQGCIYLLAGWGQVAAPNVFIVFRLKNGYSNGFFQNCFEQNQHGQQLKRHITSGARSNGLLNISKETFFNIEIPTPSLPEQQKIADCLDSADALIAAQGRKVHALKAHKKGLMQQLFPQEGETQPHLRFPEFQNNGEWVSASLDYALLTISNGLSFVQSNDATGYKVTRIETISAGTIDLERVGYVQTSQDISAYRLNVGDILFSNINSVAHIGKSVIVERDHDLYHGMNLLRLVANRTKCDPTFLFYLINTSLLRESFRGRANKAVNQASINQTELGKTLLALPALPEQQRIADCLTSFDDLIAAEGRKLDTLKTHKKGLMQQLFPVIEEFQS